MAPVNEEEVAPYSVNGRQRLVIGAAVATFLTGAAFATYGLASGFSSDQTASVPASIENVPEGATDSIAPGQQVQALTGPSETQPAPVQQVSPPADLEQVQVRLTECLNGAVDLGLQAVRDYSRECFYGYGYHLPNLYAARALGALEVRDLAVVDSDTALVSAAIHSAEQGRHLLDVRAYWVDRDGVSSQFKVVAVQPTAEGSQVLSPSVRDQVRVAFTR